MVSHLVQLRVMVEVLGAEGHPGLTAMNEVDKIRSMLDERYGPFHMARLTAYAITTA